MPGNKEKKLIWRSSLEESDLRPSETVMFAE